MDMKLGAQVADETLFEGEGGSYVSWSTAKCPLLSEANVGKLLLQPFGFALPHYADSAKIGYVLRVKETEDEWRRGDGGDSFEDGRHLAPTVNATIDGEGDRITSTVVTGLAKAIRISNFVNIHDFPYGEIVKKINGSYKYCSEDKRGCFASKRVSLKPNFNIAGVCTVGVVEPNSAEEKLVLIKKGDVIPMPLGVTSWWYNAGDSECEIVFLGGTSTSLTPGQFTYFMAGVLTTLGAFSTQFVAKASNLTEEDSETLTKSQPGVLIVKLDGGIAVPPPNKHLSGKLYKNIDAKLNALTESNFGLLGKVGLSVNYVKLGCGEIFGPVYATDSSVQMVYVVNGSGWVQITGAVGKSKMDSEVKEGELFVVPKFHPFAQIAGENGMEVLCVTTSSKPIFGYLSGNKSVWKAFSSGTLQISLGITQEFAKLFKSKV